jgi:hypothetical protein
MEENIKEGNIKEAELRFSKCEFLPLQPYMAEKTGSNMKNRNR